VADYDKVVPSGQGGEIRVKIHGTKIHPGHFSKSWTVMTNDPDNKRLVLKVAGDVKQVFRPSGQLFMSGFHDESIKGETVLENMLDTPIHITDWRWDERAEESGIGKSVGVKLEEIEKGKKYRISAWKKPDASPEMYRGEIVLTTDFPSLPEKKIPVRLTISRDVEIHPNKVYLGEMVVPEGTSKSFDRQFRIIAARGDTLKILGAEPDREDITVKIQEIQAGKVFKGTVRVRPPSTMGNFEGAIKIKTNYAGYEAITLKVGGRVRQDNRQLKKRDVGGK
jgi:hypothetical protein